MDAGGACGGGGGGAAIAKDGSWLDAVEGMLAVTGELKGLIDRSIFRF